MIILMSFGVLIGVGSSSLVSIRLGQKRIDDAEKILWQCLYVGKRYYGSTQYVYDTFLRSHINRPWR